MSSFIPRGWKQNSNKQLQRVYEECCNKAIELKLLDYTPQLYIFKSTRTWGWAKYPNKQQESDGYKAYVGLNEVYLKDPAKARNTICHELAHISCPRKEGHGYLWKSMFRKLGENFGLTQFNRCSSSSYVGLKLPENNKVYRSSPDRYRVYCPHCHYEWLYKTAGKIVQHPDRYRCGRCGVDLRSEEI